MHYSPLLDTMKDGDVLIGLPSSGPHSNGYSLIRKVVEVSGLSWQDDAPFSPKQTLAEALLEPTRIYVSSLIPLIRAGMIKGLAHITGGGVTENTPRMLPSHLTPEIDFTAWDRPPVFGWLQETGNIDEAEMRRAFNCGIGMILAVDAAQVDNVINALNENGENPVVMGHLSANDG